MERAGRLNAVAARRLVLAAGLALGAVAEWTVLRRDPLTAAPSASEVALAAADFATGAVLLVCGERCAGRIGALFAATGIAWFLGTFGEATDDRVAAVGAALVALHRGPLVHVLVAYPEGRLRDRVEVTLVAAAWGLAVAGVQATAALVALAVALAGVAARGAARAVGALRPPRRAALAASLVYAAALAASALADRERTLVWVYDAAVAAVAVGLTVDLRSGRWSQAAATGVVVELGAAAADARAVRDALAAALGDRQLRLGLWSESRQAFLEPDGQRLDDPLTIVRGDGRPLAGLVHDPELVHDAELHAAVVQAVRLAVSNLALRDEIRAQVHALESSRARLVEAADVQRAQLERRLHEGAQRRLAAVRELVTVAPGADPELRAAALVELEAAAGELRELARGLRPRLLAERGLAGALAELAPGARLDIGGARYPDAVEAAAYFVCAEALTNAAKHAPGARAHLAAGDATAGSWWKSARRCGRGVAPRRQRSPGPHGPGRRFGRPAHRLQPARRGHDGDGRASDQPVFSHGWASYRTRDDSSPSATASSLSLPR